MSTRTDMGQVMQEQSAAATHIGHVRERGTALMEWALLVILIAIVALVGVVMAGQEVSGQYSDIASAVGSSG